MKKYFIYSFGLTIAVALSIISLQANPEIMKKHAGKSKNGQNIMCTYCHTGAKIEKKANQDKKSLMKKQECLGSGCHS